MLKEYHIKLVYDGSIHKLTFRGESEGDCNYQAIKWCLENLGEGSKDWEIVDEVVLEDQSLEHFWGLDKIN